MQPLSPDDIHNRFAFHAATTEEKRSAHGSVRERCERLAMALAGNLPHGRELSIAMTKLEEVMFWANAALARTPDADDDREETTP